MNDLEEQKQNISLNYNISEPIVKNILEKIISLTITEVNKNKIERKIPDFCFKDIKQTLELAIFVDFVNYDKDDIKHKHTLLDFKSKSEKKLKILKKDDIDLSNHSNRSYQKIINRKSKSENLKKYKFSKYFDPNISFENSAYLEVFCSHKKKNKKKKKENSDQIEDKLDEIVERDDDSYNYKNKDRKSCKDIIENDDFKKKDEPFVINSHEEIENIKRTEIHDLDYNPIYNTLKNNNNKNRILYDSIIDSENNWDLITQPSAPPIDRDASTKIKYDPPNFKLHKMNSLLNQNLIKEEEENVKNKKEKEKNNIKRTASKNKLRLNILKNDEKPVKKKKYPQLIEFPSEDIDPRILGKETESEELKKLRNDLENEIALKKLEAEKKIKKEQEEIALQKALEEKRKELAHKNVTTDIKGELVYIKSLNVNDFIHEFTKGKSNFKEIKTIEDELKGKMRGRRKSILIEKNPDAFIDKEELEKSQKKKRNKNLYSSLKKANDEKKEKEKEKEKEKDKNQASRISTDKNKPSQIMWAGSNFDIMFPECGVNLIEEKKTKSGGKDYFTKYNKYSLQFFEETFNKTISSNFYQNKMNDMLSNKKNIKEQLMESIREKSSDKKIINKDLNTIMPSESNDKLLVRTKDLKRALNELDLIKEGDEKLNLDKKNRNKNILKRKKIIMNFRKHSKKDYKEIDKFAKTLMGGEDWGNNIYKTINNIKQSFKQPTKPIFDELKREVPATLLNHLPRKRLPPIINKLKDNKMGYTITEGFFNKNKKLKLKSIPKDESKKIQVEEEESSIENKNLEEKNDELDFNTNTMSNFYKNTIS